MHIFFIKWCFFHANEIIIKCTDRLYFFFTHDDANVNRIIELKKIVYVTVLIFSVSTNIKKNICYLGDKKKSV